MERKNYLQYDDPDLPFLCIRSVPGSSDCTVKEYKYNNYCFLSGDSGRWDPVDYCKDRGSSLVSFTNELDWSDELIEESE